MIIDTHTHFYDPSRPQGVPWPSPAEAWLYRTVLPAHYRALAEPLGIGGTVVVEASPWTEDNQWLLDLAHEEPFLLGIVGNLDPCAEAFPALVERFSRDPLFRGIRCGSGSFAAGNADLVTARLGLLAERGLTLDAHVGSAHLGAVAALARRLPGLRVVINHLALVAVDGRTPPEDWWRGVRQAAAEQGVFMKVSAYQELSRTQPAPPDLAYYVPVLDAVWEAFGPERLVYGSDWPVSERAGSLASGLGLIRQYLERRDPSSATAILGGNACRAYGVKLRSAQ
jgi:L-fuconolactonase